MDVLKPPERRKTLLIVEDDILLAMALKDELEDVGSTWLDAAKRRSKPPAKARRTLLW
jgi:hypothetical protein